MGVIIGITYGLYFKQSIATNIFFLILFLTISSFLIKNQKIILILLISIIISNVYLNLKNYQYEKIYKQFPEEVTIIGTIVSEQKETEYYYAYDIKLKNKKFILYIPKEKIINLEYGMQIQLEGEYSAPEKSRNYKGFDYREYLKIKKTYGSIKASNIKIIKEKNVNSILYWSNSVRNKIINTAQEILPYESSSFLTGILIGERKDISEEITESFSKSSLSHILAISGTHITYIILGITFMLTKSRIPRKARNFITILALLLFMLITGFSPSVVRACIMGILMVLAKIVHKKSDILNSIAISLIIILIYNPFLIRDVSLILSYLGTIGITNLNKPISNFLEKYINKKIASILAVTISAQIMVLPVIILEFNSFSTVFLISNLLAIPITGIIILLGYSNIAIGIISIKIGQYIAIFTNIFIQILIYIAKITAQIPFANIILTTPSIIEIMSYYLVIYCFYKEKFLKPVVIIFFTLIILFQVINLIPQDLTIHFVDVGQR